MDSIVQNGFLSFRLSMIEPNNAGVSFRNPVWAPEYTRLLETLQNFVTA